MTKTFSLITATALASFLVMGIASAQTAAPAKSDPPKTETKAPAEKKAKAERPKKPGSLECSKQADEKGLKGKERKKFRKACMKEFADKAPGAK